MQQLNTEAIEGWVRLRGDFDLQLVAPRKRAFKFVSWPTSRGVAYAAYQQQHHGGWQTVSVQDIEDMLSGQSGAHTGHRYVIDVALIARVLALALASPGKWEASEAFPGYEYDPKAFRDLAEAACPCGCGGKDCSAPSLLSAFAT